MWTSVPWDNFSNEAFWRVLHSKLLGDKMERIECVNGQLYENRTRSSWLGSSQSLPQGRHDLPHCPDGGTELAQRPKEGHLVDVLQRSPALDHKTMRPGDVSRKMQTLLTLPAVGFTCRRVPAAPPRSKSGDSAIWAFFTAVTVLVSPGPAVTAATPTVPGEDTIQSFREEGRQNNDNIFICSVFVNNNPCSVSDR